MSFAIECGLGDDIDAGQHDQAGGGDSDGVVKTLERDPRFPRLTRTDYDSLLTGRHKRGSRGSAAVPEIRHRERGGIICDAVVDESPKLANVAN